MSSFTTPLVGTFDDNMTRFTLTEQFRYRIGSMESTEIITVPAGYTTDFASTPKVIQWLIPPTGQYGKAAVIHDYLYSTGLYSREKADEIFYEAMLVLGVPKWKAYSMFKAVRMFGGSHYKGS